MSSRHSGSKTPDKTVHFGCNAFGAKTVKPRFSSAAPYTTRFTCAHPIAPAHITQGSTVTYSVHCVRYFPPSVFVAAVIACISAWAVTSSSVSVRLCPRPTTCPSATITHPTGTSPIANAFFASASASCIYRISFSISFLFNSYKLVDFIGILFKIITYHHNICSRLKGVKHCLWSSNTTSNNKWYTQLRTHRTNNLR